MSDIKSKIEFLQRKVILNSIAYYEFDTNFLSDKFYDSMSKELVDLHKEYGDISDTQYGYAFEGFDGSTGFDLVSRLTPEDQEYLVQMARHQIRMNKMSAIGGEGDGRKRRKRTSSKSSS